MRIKKKTGIELDADMPDAEKAMRNIIARMSDEISAEDQQGIVDKLCAVDLGPRCSPEELAAAMEMCKNDDLDLSALVGQTITVEECRAGDTMKA